MILLRSLFAFQFLPPGQLLNLLSEATTKALLENRNSPALWEQCWWICFFGNSPGSSPKMRKPIQPAMPGDAPHHPSQARHRSTARLKPLPGDVSAVPPPRLEPAGLLSAGSWDVASFSLQKKRVGPCGWQHGPATWQGDGRRDGWQPAVVTGTGTALGSTVWELRSSTVSLAHQPPFYCTELWMMGQKLFSEERAKKALGYHWDSCFQEKSNLSNIQSVTLHSCWKSEELLETNHTYGDIAPSLAWVGDKSPRMALACCTANTYLLGSC